MSPTSVCPAPASLPVARMFRASSRSRSEPPSSHGRCCSSLRGVGAAAAGGGGIAEGRGVAPSACCRRFLAALAPPDFLRFCTGLPPMPIGMGWLQPGRQFFLSFASLERVMGCPYSFHCGSEVPAPGSGNAT